MGKFDCEHGLCHFVFANEDVYYLDSLVGLNLQQYLYFQLREKEYSTVYFLSGDEGSYEFWIPDAVSADLYDTYGKPSFMGFFKSKSEGNKSGRTLHLSNLNDFYNRMAQILKKEKNAAFVIGIEAFSDLKNRSDIVEAFCQASEKNYSRGHLVLIQAPILADGSRFYLADENGVFRSPLFPEIQKIFRPFTKSHYGGDSKGAADKVYNNKKGIYIYERLKEEMGERVVFLNRLEWTDIRNMLKHLILTGGTDLNQYIENIDDYTDFIWAIYHSGKFGQKMGRIFTENKKRKMSEIEKNLKDRNVLRKIHNAVAKVRTPENKFIPLRREILRIYPEDSWLWLIYEDNPVLRKLEKVPMASVLEKKDGFTSSLIRKNLDHIKEALKKPFVYMEESADTGYEYQCIEYLHRACLREDWLTMEKAVVALDYGISQKSADRSFEEVDEMISDIYVSDSRQNLYLKTVQMAEKLRDITELYEQDGQRIEAYSQQLVRQVQKIKEYEKENAQVIMEYRALERGIGSDPLSGELHMISAMKSEAVTLQNDINGLKHLRANKKTLMSKCKENIQKIEMAISSIAAGGVHDLQENMEHITKIIQKVSLDNNDLLRELSDASETIQFTIEEAASMQAQVSMSDVEIDMVYEQMLENEGLKSSHAYINN